MKVIYLVEGMSGAYEEFASWIVKAFVRKEAAEAFAEEARQAAKKSIELYKKQINRWRKGDAAKPYPEGGKSALDPKMRFDGAGIEYGVIAVPLIDDELAEEPAR